MALSNIFREPRREIIETLVGLIIFSGLIAVDCLFASWFNQKYHLSGPMGYLIGIILVPLISLIIFVIHQVGEGICNLLAEMGLELRPLRSKRKGFYD